MTIYRTLLLLMMLAVIPCAVNATMQHVVDKRRDGTQTLGPDLEVKPDVVITSGGLGPVTYSPSLEIHNGTNTPFMRIKLTATGGSTSQSVEPSCAIPGVANYSDSSGDYSVTCNVKVLYAIGADYVTYNPRYKHVKINSFALDIIYEKNGMAIDPSTTGIPWALSDMAAIIVHNDQTPVSYRYEIRDKDTSTDSRLDFYIDDVVHASGDDVEINYSWSVSPGASYVSAIYTKLYIEQIDSNLELSYIKPGGTGAEVIVPNTKVILDDTYRGNSKSGSIKLKLGSITGFGTRSSRLRVTVEWV